MLLLAYMLVVCEAHYNHIIGIKSKMVIDFHKVDDAFRVLGTGMCHTIPSEIELTLNDIRKVCFE